MSADRDDRAHWEQRYAERGPELERAASRWVVDQCLAAPPDLLVVDLAGGSGRHAAALASAGRRVVVVDFAVRAVTAAVRRGHGIEGVVADARSLPLRNGIAGAVACVSFLDRTIFDALAALLAPGGRLVYETFTREHLALVERGRARGPRNPDFLLAPGELPELVAPLVVEAYEERLVDDEAGARHVARVVAVRSG